MFCCLIGGGGAGAVQSDEGQLPEDITELTFEELLEVTVTSVSLREEPLTSAAAAAFVLTGEEIAASGAASLADALRLVPGINVTRIDAHTWGVSSRGFNGSISDKLEVLMDGRSLYTPLFSGVFWEVQDALVEDIERIEVIRGPGSTIWGANAVNGVINIVTKPASASQGTLIGLGVGNERQWTGAARHGFRAGRHGHVRVYSKGWEVDDSALEDGSPAGDGFRMGFAGFRGDWQKDGSADHITVQGDLYDGREGDSTGDTELTGGDFVTRWVRSFDNGGRVQLQGYYDTYERETPDLFSEKRHTYDLSFNHTLAPRGVHNWVWGAGYRRSSDRTGRGVLIIFSPPSRTLDTVSVFVQDQLELNENVTLTLGTKFEHNDLTGDELQPGARIAWTPRDRHTIWASIARAVRIPNRLDHDLAFELPVGTPGFPDGGILELGNREFRSETLTAYEMGYRTSPRDDLTLDLAVFFNDYDDLRGVESPLPGVFLITNSLVGEGYGFELATSWRPAPGWLLQGGYSFLELDLEPKPGTNELGTDVIEGNDPDHQAFLRASWNLAARWTVNGLLRHAAHLPNQEVPAFTELDLRVAYRMNEMVELAVVGQNLLDDQHAEFGGGAQIERAVSANLTLRLNG